MLEGLSLPWVLAVGFAHGAGTASAVAAVLAGRRRRMVNLVLEFSLAALGDGLVYPQEGLPAGSPAADQVRRRRDLCGAMRRVVKAPDANADASVGGGLDAL